MKEKTACFTGHRGISASEQRRITQRLREILLQLIGEGYCCFCAGGALGFDTLAAEAVLDLKKDFPHIKLILVLPCLSQAKGRQEQDRKRYEEIKEQADKVTYVSQGYFSGCMHKRNRELVDQSSACICYLTENQGGTFYTVNYAAKQGLRILHIDEKQEYTF